VPPTGPSVTLERAGPSRALTARVLHAALFAGTAVALVTLATLRSTADAPPTMPGEGAATLLRALVLTLAAGGTIGLRVVRQALPPAPRAGGTDDWWHANLGRAVALWAFPDGVGIAGAVAYFLTGDGLVFALAAGWALAMFVMYAPGRLTA
jgi:hypothetical protein